MAGDNLDLGALLGGLLGGGQRQRQEQPQPQAQSGGGLGSNLGGNLLEGLLKSPGPGGLGGPARSWVDTGENEPVSGDQLAQALPDGTLDEVAQQAGVSREEAAEQLAKDLPDVVNKLTPDGQVPSGDSLQEIIERQMRAGG